MARIIVRTLKLIWNGPDADPLDPFADDNRERWQLGLGIVALMCAAVMVGLIAGGAS